MLILKKEGDDDVMTTGPGAGGRQNAGAVIVYIGVQEIHCVKETVWVYAGHARIILILLPIELQSSNAIIIILSTQPLFIKMYYSRRCAYHHIGGHGAGTTNEMQAYMIFVFKITRSMKLEFQLCVTLHLQKGTTHEPLLYPQCQTLQTAVQR